MSAPDTSVVFDVSVLVLAVAMGKTVLRSWPTPPPVSDNPAADCVGVINDAREFALWLSPHILENTVRVLRDRADWPTDDAEGYARLLMRLAEQGWLETRWAPPQREGRPPRHTYRLTAKGLKAAKATLDRSAQGQPNLRAGATGAVE